MKGVLRCCCLLDKTQMRYMQIPLLVIQACTAPFPWHTVQQSTAKCKLLLGSEDFVATSPSLGESGPNWQLN